MKRIALEVLDDKCERFAGFTATSLTHKSYEQKPCNPLLM